MITPIIFGGLISKSNQILFVYKHESCAVGLIRYQVSKQFGQPNSLNDSSTLADLTIFFSYGRISGQDKLNILVELPKR
jgi:hypothetical protein